MSGITRPVGATVPNLNRNEVRAVQSLLNKHRHPPLAKIAEDGVEGPQTRAAIVDFQQRILKFSQPDGRVDPNGPTWKGLNSTPAVAPIGDAAAQYFPFASLPSQSWLFSPRSFGSNRSNGARAHAGCDLYFPAGTWIHAIADGVVTAGPYPFYCQTFAIEVDHGAFLARYGEIQHASAAKKGDQVQAGQRIAKVGHLVGITVPSDMLHLELYSKNATGPLTVTSAAASKKRSDGIPFLRRTDLIDPTAYLNKWKNNLAPSA